MGAAWLSFAGVLVTAGLGLGGVLYTLRRQPRLQKLQLAAGAELEHVKHRRQAMADALDEVCTVAGRAMEDLRQLEGAIVDAENQQFTVPGRAPTDTDRIVTARQACRLSAGECAVSASRLPALGLVATRDAAAAFGAAVGSYANSPRPHLGEDALGDVVAQHSALVDTLRGEIRTALGDNDDGV